MVSVRFEGKTAIKYDTQVPHGRGAGDSGTLEFNADRGETLNILTGAENDQLVFFCALTFKPFLPNHLERSERLRSIELMRVPMSPGLPETKT